jgi:activator of HSP90 ATPase
MEFTLTAFFDTTPQNLYNTWLDSDGHTAMTGGAAEITADEGDAFHTWDGYIWGKNLKLVTDHLIQQSWRTSDFKEDQEYSLLEITLEKKDGGTFLTLRHSQLTAEDEHYVKGWEDHYFSPMKAYFSHQT